MNEFYDKEGLKPEDEYYVNPKVGDKYYGMQMTAGYQFVLLNKDALDEAGLPVPTYGWTWDDFRDYAKKLTKGEGVDKRYGTYFHTWELYMNALTQTVMKDPFRYDDGTTILSTRRTNTSSSFARTWRTSTNPRSLTPIRLPPS